MNDHFTKLALACLSKVMDAQINYPEVEDDIQIIAQALAEEYARGMKDGEAIGIAVEHNKEIRDAAWERAFGSKVCEVSGVEIK